MTVTTSPLRRLGFVARWALLLPVIALLAWHAGAWHWERGVERLLALTDPEPTFTAVPSPSKDEQVVLQKRWEAFLKAKPAAEPEIALEAADLAALFRARTPLARFFDVRPENGVLAVTCAAPLGEAPLVGRRLAGRFLTLRGILLPTVQNGRLGLELRDLRFRGEPVTGVWRARLEKAARDWLASAAAAEPGWSANYRSAQVTGRALVLKR